MQIIPRDYTKSSNFYCVVKSIYSIKLFTDDTKQNGLIYYSAMYDKNLDETAENFDILLKIPIVQIIGDKHNLQVTSITYTYIS